MLTKLPQTRAHSNAARGNCWEACIHSLLGDEEIVLDLGVTDDKVWDNHWLVQTNAYLATRGFTVVLCTDHRTVFMLSPDLVYIATGPSPRGPFNHAVLHRSDVLWHDPYPTGVGLDRITGMAYLVALNEAPVPCPSEPA